MGNRESGFRAGVGAVPDSRGRKWRVWSLEVGGRLGLRQRVMGGGAGQ